jgi:hypothetical protein
MPREIANQYDHLGLDEKRGRLAAVHLPKAQTGQSTSTSERVDLSFNRSLVPWPRRRKIIMPDMVSTAATAISQDERIRQRAYEIWEHEGRTGNPEDHWFRAELELAEQGQGRSDATLEDAPPLPL